METLIAAASLSKEIWSWTQFFEMGQLLPMQEEEKNFLKIMFSAANFQTFAELATL